jgi:hypothetical protein
LSFARENAGALVRDLLGEHRSGPTRTIRDLIFGTDALDSVTWSSISFQGCTFGPTSLQGTRLTDIEFQSCNFQDVYLATDCTLSNVAISPDTEIHSVFPDGWDTGVYAPEAKIEFLKRAGFVVRGQMNLDSANGASLAEPDERLRVVERAIRIFFRSTEINEDTFRTRLGNQAAQFLDSIVPQLLSAGALEEVAYRGKGHQVRYRLKCPLQELRFSLENSGGNYDVFIDDLRNRRVGRLT